MSGAAIVRALLAAHPPVQAIITNPAQIVLGVVPVTSPVPALSVSSVGENEVETMARNLPVKMIRERVQVTALARDYPTMSRLLKAAALGAGVHTGTVAGFKVRSVLPLGTNPEIPPGDDKIYEQSRDFMVTFIEAN